MRPRMSGGSVRTAVFARTHRVDDTQNNNALLSMTVLFVDAENKRTSTHLHSFSLEYIVCPSLEGRMSSNNSSQHCFILHLNCTSYRNELSTSDVCATTSQRSHDIYYYFGCCCRVDDKNTFVCSVRGVRCVCSI